ncbi:hypothetical protein PP459_gp192 [Streptomyces phage Wakanda]|uniref:Uncharacterized protein n=2 Tax=Wakandavirus TaxID=3044854 RepID=A0A6G8R336_9CAUD|nr:hypothetical protein PP459_gp192 [Streptomyces phage Wakanda]YP_010652361.1 hypothetical protein PP460_gp197 [Streptomyces phage Muntaha]QIN94042.1 hypothetical protein SEA_WAKANDA_49 [Streptomyces phage Wakanda]QIN94607.1 hypothetical protein SEA_MUNTAHA_50 [Streptomyces phage Muntaha]
MTIKIKRAPQYETFGNELDAEVALLQAASAIDMAIYLAVQSGNVEKLLDGAAMWIGMAERLANGLESDDDDEPKDNPNKPPFGFCNGPTSEPVTPDVIMEAEPTEEENDEDA